MVILATLVGCGSVGQGKIGPFGGSGSPGTECVPIKTGDIVTDGFDKVANSGQATAVIDKVAFADPHGLRQIAAYAVPVAGGLYGDWTGYPPDHPVPGFHWAERQAADGATVPHTTGPGGMNILVVAQVTGKRGTASGVDIYYHVGSQHYHLRTSTALVALIAKTC
jgi:hypothetical protein